MKHPVRKWLSLLVCAAIVFPAMALSAAADNAAIDWDNGNAIFVNIKPDSADAVLANPDSAFPAVNPAAVYIQGLQYDVFGNVSLELLLVLTAGEDQQTALDVLAVDQRVLSVRKCDEVPFDPVNTLRLTASSDTVAVGGTITLQREGELSVYTPIYGPGSLCVTPKDYSPDRIYTPADFPQVDAVAADNYSAFDPGFVKLTLAASDYFDIIRAVDILARDPGIRAAWLSPYDVPPAIDRPAEFCAVSDPTVAQFVDPATDNYMPDTLVGKADENGDYVLRGLHPGTVTVTYYNYGFYCGPYTATATITVTDGILGDVNNDGSIDTVDARMILQYIVGKLDAAPRADVNIDGKVDTVDVRLVLQYIVGKINSFFPDPPPLSPLTENQGLKIKNDFIPYLQALPPGMYDVTDDAADIAIGTYIDDGSGYLGTYNGCEVVVLCNMSGRFYPLCKFITVAGYTIVIPDLSDCLLVHQGDDFLTLQEAYDNQILSEHDLSDIRYYSRQWYNIPAASFPPGIR